VRVLVSSRVLKAIAPNLFLLMRDCRMAQTVIADDPLVTREDEFSVERDEQGRIRISTTDGSQF
jgi:hypothetical protein